MAAPEAAGVASEAAPKAKQDEPSTDPSRMTIQQELEQNRLQLAEVDRKREEHAAEATDVQIVEVAVQSPAVCRRDYGATVPQSVRQAANGLAQDHRVREQLLDEKRDALWRAARHGTEESLLCPVKKMKS